MLDSVVVPSPVNQRTTLVTKDPLTFLHPALFQVPQTEGRFRCTRNTVIFTSSLRQRDYESSTCVQSQTDLFTYYYRAITTSAPSFRIDLLSKSAYVCLYYMFAGVCRFYYEYAPTNTYTDTCNIHRFLFRSSYPRGCMHTDNGTHSRVCV